MDFELKAILPALGVVAGWFLNEISQILKSRRIDRRLINESLYSLLDLAFILNQKRALLNCMIKANQFSDFHFDLVAKLYEDKRFASDEFKAKILKAINDLAVLDPMLCQGFRINAASVELFDKIKRYEPNDKGMKNDIESQYKALNVFTQQLDLLVRKLLIKHSILMRVKYAFYKRRDLSEDKSAWNLLFQTNDSLPDQLTELNQQDGANGKSGPKRDT